MPKLKTHKGAAKRFRVTKNGKVMRRQATKNHMLSKKTTKQKRQLRKSTRVVGAFAASIREMLRPS